MFTGIVEGAGEVAALKKRGEEVRFTFLTPFPIEEVHEGESIAVEGACLTVAGFERQGFTAFVSQETLSLTTLGGLKVGDPVNMERALRLDSRLGGHMVTGHVDGLGTVDYIRPEGDSVRMGFTVPRELGRYIVKKGSVAINGVSLTVNEAGPKSFGVNLIPHTMKVTTLGRLKHGSTVNIETDIIGKYVARLIEAHLEEGGSRITEDFLKKHGY